MGILLPFFFLSGFAGLVYETLWTRDLTHVIGGSPYAISVILTLFMAGLGAGGLLGGKLADRLKSPAALLAAYGACEIAIGLYALILPALLRGARPAFAALYANVFTHPFAYHLLVFLLASALLLIPVLCMGATLPLLTRYRVRGPARVAAPVGLLYGLNTAGAAAGVLCAGFWLLPAIGLRATSLAAAALDIAVGAACLALARKAASKGEAFAWESTPVRKSAIPTSPAGYRTAVAAFAVSGFCAMAYEVVWTKVLTLVMGPTTYAFTLVLAIFIGGLALGGWLCGRFADRAGNPALWLAVTQGFAALSSLAVSQRMGNSLFLFQKIDQVCGDGFASALALKALFLGVFMLAPTLCLGAAFPLVMRMAAPGEGRVGRALGGAYAWNTVGGVLGSWSAGFLLIPAMGSERTLGSLAAAQAVAAALLAFRALRGRGEKPSRWAASLAASGLALALCAVYPHWDREALGRAVSRPPAETVAAVPWTAAMLARVPHERTLMPHAQVYYGDGIGGFTSVWEDKSLMGGSDFSLYVSGKADASSRLDMFTQVLLAQFPLALHPDPRKVMVLGLASGVTAGEVLAHPVERVDILEINPQVVAASEWFKPWNGDVLKDPRARLIVQDAKAHLLLSRERYDVIISEPSNPWMAGLGELFTREFFERARDRLNEGGILVEFLHSYQMDWPVFSLVGRTFAQVFPEGMLVRTMPDDRRLPGSASDYLLVGVKGGSLHRIPDTQAKRAALARSRNFRLADPLLLYRQVESENLAALFGPGPINTDDRPLLEFQAPKLRFTMDSRAIEAAIATGPALSPATSSLRDSLRADPAGRLAFAQYAFSLSKPFPGMLDWKAADSLQRETFGQSLDRYCESVHVVDWDFLDDAAMKMRCAVHQMAALNKALKTGGSAATYLAMGEVCMESGVPANAYKFYGKALEAAGEGSDVGREALLRMQGMRSGAPSADSAH